MDLTSIRELRDEAADRPSRPEIPVKKIRKSRDRSSSGAPRKTPAKQAPLWSSMVAERWMTLAAENGFEPPYNANFLANEIESRVRREPKIMRLGEEGRAGDIQRWVMKMTELFWKTDWPDEFSYVRAGDTASRIKDVFLVECWDDLVDVAFDSLRAAYLKVHGHSRSANDYGDHAQSGLHQELAKVRLREFVAREEQARAETRELHVLDEQARAVLSSAQERKAGS